MRCECRNVNPLTLVNGKRVCPKCKQEWDYRLMITPEGREYGEMAEICYLKAIQGWSGVVEKEFLNKDDQYTYYLDRAIDYAKNASDKGDPQGYLMMGTLYNNGIIDRSQNKVTCAKNATPYYRALLKSYDSIETKNTEVLSEDKFNNYQKQAKVELSRMLDSLSDDEKALYGIKLYKEVMAELGRSTDDLSEGSENIDTLHSFLGYVEESKKKGEQNKPVFCLAALKTDDVSEFLEREIPNDESYRVFLPGRQKSSILGEEDKENVKSQINSSNDDYLVLYVYKGKSRGRSDLVSSFVKKMTTSYGEDIDKTIYDYYKDNLKNNSKNKMRIIVLYEDDIKYEQMLKKEPLEELLSEEYLGE